MTWLKTLLIIFKHWRCYTAGFGLKFEFGRFLPITGQTGPVSRNRGAAVRSQRSVKKTLSAARGEREQVAVRGAAVGGLRGAAATRAPAAGLRESGGATSWAASRGSVAARPACGAARPARGDGSAACKEQRAAREQPETRTAHGCSAKPKHTHARNHSARVWCKSKARAC